jgi:hypothetical protein
MTIYTHLVVNFLLISLLSILPLHTTAVLHAEPRIFVDIGVDVVLIVGQFDVIPFGVVEGLAHDGVVLCCQLQREGC